MSVRENFEEHMRGLNPCTDFRRTKVVPCPYRAITVERAWQLWRASNQRALLWANGRLNSIVVAHYDETRGEGYCKALSDSLDAIRWHPGD